ncbi:uncharacterized protein TNCV_2514551 [Trichonephila clavipes]|nr:uncharacterized protein TNCV_2514551 [Trichonephila clavipes]
MALSDSLPQITLGVRIPTQLACAYLKGHLTGRALDWFEVLGYRVVEDKATDYAHLKQALTKQFPVVVAGGRRRCRVELFRSFYRVELFSPVELSYFVSTAKLSCFSPAMVLVFELRRRVELFSLTAS